MKLLPIVLRDELTGETAFDFADGLARHGFEDWDGIAFQMSSQSALDVNGLAVIVRIYSHMESLGKRMYVVDAPTDIARAIARLGLTRVLNAPDVARRPPLDTDPTLSTLTGSYRVVE